MDTIQLVLIGFAIGLALAYFLLRAPRLEKSYDPWKNAPLGFNYWTVDKNGKAYYFKYKAASSFDLGIWYLPMILAVVTPAHVYMRLDTNFKKHHFKKLGVPWYASIQTRPGA